MRRTHLLVSQSSYKCITHTYNEKDSSNWNENYSILKQFSNVPNKENVNSKIHPVTEYMYIDAIYICVCICIYMHICAHICTHIYIHTCMYVYSYILHFCICINFIYTSYIFFVLWWLLLSYLKTHYFSIHVRNKCLRGWNGDSAVKSTSCSFRGL